MIRHQNSIPMTQINYVYIISLVVIEVPEVNLLDFLFVYMYYHKVLSSPLNEGQLNSSAHCKEVMAVF